MLFNEKTRGDKSRNSVLLMITKFFLRQNAFCFAFSSVHLCSVVGKLLLKSNGITLLPLLLKETSYFHSISPFFVTVLLLLLVTTLLKVTNSLLVTTKSNYLRSGTVTPLHLSQ